MDELWEAASGDHDHFAREAALARADAEMEGVLPFLLAARTADEYAHRSYLAQESIRGIAARNGLGEDELMAVARRRYELYREALMEGTDPVTSLEPLLNGGGFGSGPERPLEHEEGPDFSGGYSEVPMGPLSGPDPRVTAPRPPQLAPASQVTGSLRRQADAAPGSMMMPGYAPPDLGTGNGSVDIGVAGPQSGGYTPSVPAGMPGGSVAPVGTGQQVTSSRDPVRRRVLQVTAMITRANPGLPRAECERVARQVVSRYLREADLADSAMSNGPMSGGDGGSSGGGQGGSSHGEMAKNMLAGQGLRSMLPGSGGAAAGAGEAAGGAAELAELAPLVAL